MIFCSSMSARLAAGSGVAEILSGYPNLGRRKLELGRLWVAAHPRRGRPKRLSEFGFKLISTHRRPLPANLLSKPVETADA
jgi:hypothetical protein